MTGVTHITVEQRRVYGNLAFYPADPTAEKFAAIAGTTTLTRSVLDKIKAMGVQINVIQERVQL